MKNNGHLEVIRESRLVAGMTEEEIEALVPLFSDKELGGGTTVFLENMPAESLYLIRSGSIQISKTTPEGIDRTLVVLGPEDVFGEMAVLDEGARSTTARVAEKARLLTLCKGDFDTFCEKNPHVGLKLMRNVIRLISQRMRETQEEYRELLTWSLGGKI